MKIRESLFKYEEYDFELDLLTIFPFFVNSAHDVNRKVWRKPTASLSQRAVANEKKEAGLCCLIGLCPAYSSFILAPSSCGELKTMGFTKVAIIVFLIQIHWIRIESGSGSRKWLKFWIQKRYIYIFFLTSQKYIQAPGEASSPSGSSSKLNYFCSFLEGPVWLVWIRIPNPDPQSHVNPDAMRIRIRNTARS